jgi:hypothetical protein
MIEIDKIFLFLILVLLMFVVVTNARAAKNTAEMPIKAKIIRCVTPEEREKACVEHGACCHLIEPGK